MLALSLTGVLTLRFGPRGPLIFGGLSAALGMGLVSVAQNFLLLAVGVILAASSAGFSWVPYNNATGRAVSTHLRERVLSIISTGTTFGVAAAAFLSWFVVVFEGSWRLTWGLFAACGLVAASLNTITLRQLRAPQAGKSEISQVKEGWLVRELLTFRALTLFGAALSFGATSSVYLSFAVDRVVNAGGLPGIQADAAGPALFMSYGLAGIIGVFTGELEKKIGVVRLLRITFLCSTISLALIGFVPGHLIGVVTSSALQGACVMSTSAILAFWSLRFFPFTPAVSFTVILLFLAAGNMAGPVMAGMLASSFDMGVAFLSGSGLSFLTALAIPSHRRIQV